MLSSVLSQNLKKKKEVFSTSKTFTYFGFFYTLKIEFYDPWQDFITDLKKLFIQGGLFLLWAP